MVDEMGREDMERKLDGYYAAERADLRAPGDLWANVSARLGEQDPAPWWRPTWSRRVFGGAALHGMGRVYAGAAAALAVAVVGAVMYTAILGTGGSGGEHDKSASATSTTAAVAAAVPAAPAAPEAAPVAAAAEASADAAMTDAAMADAVPRAPSGLTQNASAAATDEEPPFRHEIWGLLNGARTRLFWVALPERWTSSEPMYAGGVWTGVISGPEVTLEYSFGEWETREALHTATLTEAAARQQRMLVEYVIGNRAFIVAPPEGSVGDLRMTLQLPTGTLRFTGEAFGPFQQELALMVFRSIIA